MQTIVSVAWGFFLALGALAAFIGVVAMVRRWPMMPLYAVTVFAAIVWDFPTRPALANIGGSSIYFEDVLILVVLAATAYGPQRFLRVVKSYNVLVIVALLLIAISFAVGIGTFGLNTAANEFRSFFYTFGITVWALNQDWTGAEAARKFKTWATITGICLTGVGLLHITLYGLGRADSFVISQISGDEMTGRPLTSDQAVLLVLVACILLKGATTSRKRDTILAVLFVGVSIIAQQRSAWLALAVAIVPVIFRLRGTAATRTIIATFWLALVGGMVLLSGVANDAIQRILYSLQAGGTYAGRVDAWTALVDQSVAQDGFSVFFGEPFGYGYTRLDSAHNTFVSYAPHNWYISVFLRMGVIGLAIYAYVLFRTFWRLMASRGLLAETAALVAIAVYTWNYSLSWQLAPVLAWALAASLPVAPHPKPKKLSDVEQRLELALRRQEQREPKPMLPAL